MKSSRSVPKTLLDKSPLLIKACLYCDYVLYYSKKKQTYINEFKDVANVHEPTAGTTGFK